MRCAMLTARTQRLGYDPPHSTQRGTKTMMKLYIGNKNYSSWSMRPWVLMKQAGIEFDEVKVRFDSFAPSSTFKREILRVNPIGRVPVLVDGDLVVWDTLAIAEYLAEQFPEKRLWPADRKARARARSVSAEMHSGFGALRSELLETHGGPMLFGEFSIADAFFAPVAMRLRTYRAPVPPIVAAYIGRVAEAPGIAAWIADALAEKDFLQFEEPYRTKP